MKNKTNTKKLVTLESIDAKIDTALASIDAKINSLDTKIDVGLSKVDERINDLTRITAKSFEGMHVYIDHKIDGLDQKIDYRFDSLSNRIDDLIMNKVSYEAHGILSKRVTALEKGSDL